MAPIESLNENSPLPSERNKLLLLEKFKNRAPDLGAALGEERKFDPQSLESAVKGSKAFLKGDPLPNPIDFSKAEKGKIYRNYWLAVQKYNYTQVTLPQANGREFHPPIVHFNRSMLTGC